MPDSTPLTPVRVRTRKWPDSPHWEFDALFLGEDDHGTWIGLARGTPLIRPGREDVAREDHVCLAPHDDWWLATFYGVGDPGRPFDIYVDVSTPPEVEPQDPHDLDDEPAPMQALQIHCIDLDLDVVRGTSGRVFVDDEDEFAQHRRELDYPQFVVDEAISSADWLETSIRAGTAPFDAETSSGWLRHFRELLQEDR